MLLVIHPRYTKRQNQTSVGFICQFFWRYQMWNAPSQTSFFGMFENNLSSNSLRSVLKSVNTFNSSDKMVFSLCDVCFNRNIGFEKGNSVIHQTYHSKQMLLVNARHFNWMLQFGEWTEFILKIYMIWSVLYKQSAWIFVPIERIEWTITEKIWWFFKMDL